MNGVKCTENLIFGIPLRVLIFGFARNFYLKTNVDDYVGTNLSFNLRLVHVIMHICKSQGCQMVYF
jgi:hypothetical protein